MLIETKNLTKLYGKKMVLENLNIRVKKGQLLAYIGTNGAGKSTTIKILTGLLSASSGQVNLAPGLKIGMVFQDSVLDEELTVQANLESRAGLYHHQDSAWLKDLIKMLAIEDILKQEYGTLSGGQRRRVDIARALLTKPDLLFLDEPTTGLDIQSRRSIWALLRRLQKEEGLTIFLTTHYLEEAENADMAYIIDHGRVLAQGSAEKLKTDYAKNRLLIKTDNKQAWSDQTYQEREAGWLAIEDLSPQQALSVLASHQDYILDFDFQKGDINAVFMAVAGTVFKD